MMHAMILEHPGEKLKFVTVPKPTPGPMEVLIKVNACGVCRTDLHVIDGELPHPKLPIIPGHQIVGEVEAMGDLVKKLQIGQKVGVPWLGYTCGHCHFCISGQENLCDNAKFTGYLINGGFAEYCLANEHFCFPIPKDYQGSQAAPLLCAGLIGYRTLSKTGSAKRVGLYGFGAAAHIVIQIAKFQGREIYAFTQPGDTQAQEFAMKLGAIWAGAANQPAPHLLDAAIIFAPVGELVPIALHAVNKGGIVVCGGIHMSDIPSFPYRILWGERILCSVANLTRKDGVELLGLAPQIPITTEVHTYPLKEANQALDDLRHGQHTGALVITV